MLAALAARTRRLRLGLLAETIEILERMWSEPEFDFHGRYYTLLGNRNEPKRPPLLIGGWGDRTVRASAISC